MARTMKKGTKATAGSKRVVKDLPAPDGHAVKGGMLSKMTAGFIAGGGRTTDTVFDLEDSSLDTPQMVLAARE